MATYKVLDIHDRIHLVCTYTQNATDPYRLYLTYKSYDSTKGYTATHKHLIAKYADMTSVICMIKDIYINYVQNKPIDQVLAWCKHYYNEQYPYPYPFLTTRTYL